MILLAANPLTLFREFSIITGAESEKSNAQEEYPERPGCSEGTDGESPCRGLEKVACALCP